MMLAVILAATTVTAVPAEISLVGLWESKETSRGGIGNAMWFRGDGSVVEAIAVMVEIPYRLTGDRLDVAQEPSAGADASKSANIRFEGDVLVLTGPDGSVLRKQRLPGKEKGSSPIVGLWRYCHPTGAIAYDRFTEAGRLHLRLLLKSSTGRYSVRGNEVTLSRPEQPEVKLTVEARTDDLVVARPDGKKIEYRRERLGAWYDVEHAEKCSRAVSASPD